VSARALEERDYPAVANLYERVVRSGSSQAAPGLEDYFRRLDGGPWADPDIPSLVWDDPEAGIVGYLGSHVRRLTLEGNPRRMACSGQLVADPGYRHPGVGALLLRTYLAGPQDLTITDGATPEVRVMWEALGGRSLAAQSIGWTIVLGPAAFGTALAERRFGATGPLRAAAPVVHAIDSLAGRRARPVRPAGNTEPLTTELFVEQLGAFDRSFRLIPAYDVEAATWLFREAEAVSARGELQRMLVRGEDGRALGWYVAYLRPDGISQVMQLGAPRRSVGAVLDHLLWQAHEVGSAAVQGRVEPYLLAELRERRCLLRRTEWALVHGDPAALAAMAFGQALVSRLEGEWWMGHHLTPLPRPKQAARPPAQGTD
jgi:hypothetical protein